MGGARYRRGGIYAADMARYAYLLSEENTNTQEMDRVKLALWRALHEDITEKQRQYLLLYYGEGMDKSTVSRTIKRGEERLRRCLRYGAKRFLADEEPPRAMTAGKGGCYYQRRG